MPGLQRSDLRGRRHCEVGSIYRCRALSSVTRCSLGVVGVRDHRVPVISSQGTPASVSTSLRHAEANAVASSSCAFLFPQLCVLFFNSLGSV
ncbi:hypothetical protein U1Q18_048764 [Sarracenia purpurea var. burkii]